MTTSLVPMTAASFDRYVKWSARQLADALIASGSCAKASALRRARAAFAQTLPKGLRTPGHQLFDLKAGAQSVGILWFGTAKRMGGPQGYVYDIFIHPKFRGQGHGSRALKAAEELARSKGFSSLGLHVFSYNRKAQSLYERFGFRATGINMVKRFKTRAGASY
jgi:ribosomal protein S18 acetylase RimI-like enzyme